MIFPVCCQKTVKEGKSVLLVSSNPIIGLIQYYGTTAHTDKVLCCVNVKDIKVS